MKTFTRLLAIVSLTALVAACGGDETTAFKNLEEWFRRENENNRIKSESLGKSTVTAI